MNVSSIGSGGGDVRVALPVAVAPGETYWDGGTNQTTGQQIQVRFVAGEAIITTPTNGYPVASGQTLLISVDYEPVPL